VLERYSDQECSLLLNCTRADVMAARIRAIQQIGKSADRYGDVDSFGPYGESSSQWNSTRMKGQKRRWV
jgi:hypothetical protein